jgi:hypothetical protein
MSCIWARCIAGLSFNGSHGNLVSGVCLELYQTEYVRFDQLFWWDVVSLPVWLKSSVLVSDTELHLSP